MPEEPRITDHEPVIAAARQDAGREGARFVSMTIGELWRLIHQAPTRQGNDIASLSHREEPG